MSPSLSVGFACHWDRAPRGTWSGTPWQLRESLRGVAEVTDFDVGPPVPARAALKAAGMRRHDGQWRSLWRHSRIHTRWAEVDLSHQARAVDVDAVVQIQDLGRTPQPYLILQDLSYGLLLDRYGIGNVPHFRSLGAARIRQLHERQLRLYQDAAGLLPMSRWLAADLIASGVAPDRVHVINPGVTLPSADRPVPQRRSSGTHRLLLVGRDFDTKGGQQVVAAFELLRSSLGSAVTLTVIGPPAWPLRGPVPDGVRFLGPQPGNVVAQALDDHDLFVMPSLLEGFGIAFAEALVRGLPCIGRDDCAMPEIIDQETGGRLVRSENPGELAELIVATLSDDNLYAACAAAAPVRREHYTWDRAASQVLDAVRAAGG